MCLRIIRPEEVFRALQARLDALPREERELLQRASVVGRLFWDAVVARLGVPRDAILMIGDDLAIEVRAPRRCGIAAVWLNWKRAPVPDDAGLAVVARLAELPGLIAGRSLAF